MGLSKHEAPKPRLILQILDILSEKEAPLLVCTKILLLNLGIFGRLLSEYNPDEHSGNFCLVLKMLQTLCRIGGVAPSGRRAVTTTDVGADKDIHHGKKTAVEEQVDSNGFRLISVREHLLNGSLVEIVTNSIICSRVPSVHAAAMSFLCDLAIEEKACVEALPQSLLRLLSSSRRACKQLALTMLTQIFQTASARLTLLPITAAPESREWIMKALPHLWRILLDGRGPLQAQGAECIVQIYISLCRTEVGSAIGYGLASLLVLDTEFEGKEILVSPKYSIAPWDMNSEEGVKADGVAEIEVSSASAVAAGKGSTGAATTLVVAHILSRILAEAEQANFELETIFSSLRDRGVPLAMFYCLLFNARALQDESIHLYNLQFSVVSKSPESIALSYRGIVLQEALVQDMQALQLKLLQIFQTWGAVDTELCWTVQLLYVNSKLFAEDIECPMVEPFAEKHMQRPSEHCFSPDIDYQLPLRKLNSTEVKAFQMNLENVLQLGMRRGMMRRCLDDCSRMDGAADTLQPTTFMPVVHSPRHTPRVRLDSASAETPPVSGVLGYLLLKKVFEKHGVLSSMQSEQELQMLEVALHTEDTTADFNTSSTSGSFPSRHSHKSHHRAVTTTQRHHGFVPPEELLSVLQVEGDRRHGQGTERGQHRHNPTHVPYVKNHKSPKKAKTAQLHNNLSSSHHHEGVYQAPAPPQGSKPLRSVSGSARRVTTRQSPASPPAPVKPFGVQVAYSLNVLQALADGLNTTYITQPECPSPEVDATNQAPEDESNRDGLSSQIDDVASMPRQNGYAADKNAYSTYNDLPPFVEQPLDAYFANLQAPQPKVLPTGEKAPKLRRIKIVKKC